MTSAVVGGWLPFRLKFAIKVTHPFRTPRFRPISAHSASTVRAGEKSSISTNRKSTTCYPTSHRWNMYFTPKSPKGGIKRDFAVFASQIQLVSKEVCCKVSSCENFQQQSCSYIIPLSNSTQMDCGGRRPHLPKIYTQSDPPLPKKPISTDFA